MRAIRITGDPALHAPAEPVTEFDAALRSLVADLNDTMHEAPGVGLAAPQVGVPLRVFVYDWLDENDVAFSGVAINPELWIAPTPIGEADDDDESEGCLSIPGERFALRRSSGAILRAVDLAQKPFEVRAEGWLARIFQHEFDHLDGILYTDRLDHVRHKAAQKAIRKRDWGVPDVSWTPGEEHLEG